MITKTIPKHPDYTISKTGKVWSKRRKCFLNPWLRNGYLAVGFTHHSKSKYFYVHRLILETFVGPCPIGMECRHLNGDKRDNGLKNICWGTHSENVQDSVEHGTCPGLLIGENNSRAKLKDSDARIIVYLYRTGLFRQREIANIYNINCSRISSIINKRTWKHIWRDIPVEGDE